MEHILLTATEVAKTLKISIAHFHNLITNGEIPFNRYHRRVIVKLEDLNTYLAGRANTRAHSHGRRA